MLFDSSLNKQTLDQGPDLCKKFSFTVTFDNVFLKNGTHGYKTLTKIYSYWGTP